MMENLYNERRKTNALRAKADSAKSLGKQQAATKKAKFYLESVQDAVIKAKEIAEGSLEWIEANKKQAEENLAYMHTMYNKLETKTAHVQAVLKTNNDNDNWKQWIDCLTLLRQLYFGTIL